MCGIAGSYNWGDARTLERMGQIQAHRGPDDAGSWECRAANGDWVGLASRRLAILDLSPAGHMPMSTPDQQLTIVYNGEIYNSPALRAELEQGGCRFRSGTDTEVVLRLYERDGADCLRRLNGMFAFAIWDNRRQCIFLARDHFGIKPLYYCQQGGRLAFASEAKALLDLPGMDRQIDFTALHQYLTFLWVPDPLTMFKGVFKLPAAHFAVFQDGKLTVTQFWDLTFPKAGTQRSSNEAELANELRERFSRVVEAQMLSDVPVGAFLSAGLDSSSIVAAMARASQRPVRTYTIGFPERYRRGELTLDDVTVARRTAQHFGCEHTEILVEPNVVDLLPKLVWHMDEPVADPALIAAYLVSREARKTVTVLLSGVGGDELFAGYRKYRAHYLAAYYRRLPALVRKGLIEPMIGALPAFRGTRFKGYVRLAKKMVRSGSLGPKERFLTDSVYLSDRQKEELYTDRVVRSVNGQQAWGRHLAHFDRVSDADFLDQMLYVDLKTFMVSLNLTYNDRMSMASSVEVRVPFLDWELAEWVAANVPPGLKLRGSTTKHILRQAMGPSLPAEVLTQRKAGFGAPVDHWLAHDLSEMIGDLLGDDQVRRRGLFKPAAVQQLVQEQRSGRADWSLQLWQLLTLELWMRTFLDSSPAVVPAAAAR